MGFQLICLFTKNLGHINTCPIYRSFSEKTWTLKFGKPLNYYLELKEKYYFQLDPFQTASRLLRLSLKPFLHTKDIITEIKCQFNELMEEPSLVNKYAFQITCRLFW